MNEQDGYSGFSPSQYGAPAPYVAPPAAPVAPPPAAAMVRPLSTGEILDRTFALYRRRFWLFAGIGTVPGLVITLSGIVRIVFLALTHRSISVTPGMTPQAANAVLGNMVIMQAFLLPSMLLFLMAHGISNAAAVEAVSRLNVGELPTAAESYRAIRGRWLRWVGISLRQYWSFFWPVVPAIVVLFGSVAIIPRVSATGAVAIGLLAVLAWLGMIAGIVLGAINFLRVALAVPAGVSESLGVSAALRRSRDLVAGRKGRIFLALLLVYVLQGVFGAAEIPLAFLANASRGAEQILLEVIQLLLQFLVITLISPIASIALCLFYIDERVRREGFDIELLMRRSFGTPAPVALQPGAPPEVTTEA